MTGGAGDAKRHMWEIHAAPQEPGVQHYAQHSGLHKSAQRVPVGALLPAEPQCAVTLCWLDTRTNEFLMRGMPKAICVKLGWRARSQGISIVRSVKVWTNPPYGYLLGPRFRQNHKWQSNLVSFIQR
jgi:hypothetical protein